MPAVRMKENGLRLKRSIESFAANLRAKILFKLVVPNSDRPAVVECLSWKLDQRKVIARIEGVDLNISVYPFIAQALVRSNAVEGDKERELLAVVILTKNRCLSRKLPGTDLTSQPIHCHPSANYKGRSDRARRWWRPVSWVGSHL